MTMRVAGGESPAPQIFSYNFFNHGWPAFLYNDEVLTYQLMMNGVYASAATDVNNDNLAVGYVTKNVSWSD